MPTGMTVVTTETTHPGAAYRSQFRKIAIAEFVLGGLVLLLGIIVVILYATSGLAVASNSGIWCGIFFIVMGIMAILSHKRPNQCNLIAGMVLAIIGIILSLAVISWESQAAFYIFHYNGFYPTLIINVLLAIAGVCMLVVSIFHIVYTSKATCCA